MGCRNTWQYQKEWEDLDPDRRKDHVGMLGQMNPSPHRERDEWQREQAIPRLFQHRLLRLPQIQTQTVESNSHTEEDQRQDEKMGRVSVARETNLLQTTCSIGRVVGMHERREGNGGEEASATTQARLLSHIVG